MLYVWRSKLNQKLLRDSVFEVVRHVTQLVLISQNGHQHCLAGACLDRWEPDVDIKLQNGRSCWAKKSSASIPL